MSSSSSSTYIDLLDKGQGKRRRGKEDADFRDFWEEEGDGWLDVDCGAHHVGIAGKKKKKVVCSFYQRVVFSDL